MASSIAIAAHSLVDDPRIGTRATSDPLAQRAQLADRPLDRHCQATAAQQDDLVKAAPDGVLGQAEGDPVGIPLPEGDRGAVDELAADGVEHAMGPEFLTHSDLGLRAESAPGALSNFEFLAQDLDFPTLAVELGQFQRVGRAGVEQGGEQAVDLSAGLEPVLDDPDREGITPPESDQIAAVGQVADAALADVLLGPPEEVHTGLVEGLPERLGRETSISQQEHAWT